MAKTILITGGTTGIGRCTAYKFGRNGYNVAFTSRSEERGKKFETELREAGIEASFFQLDVTDEAAVKATIDGVVARYGAMQTIVNNAGIAGETKLLADNSTDNFREMIETNVMGLYYGMKYAIRYYLTVGGGRIVNLASIAGLNGIPYAVQYCATKHAVVGLTKGAAVEYASKNIRVNAVAPCAVKTDILRTAIESGTYDEASMGAMNPINRMGEPDEIAGAIYFLASDDASLVNGAILCADGGFSAS